jgi:hypothetical protein
MSTSVDTEEFTTATYAEMASSGKWTPAPAPDASKGAKPATAAPAAADVPKEPPPAKARKVNAKAADESASTKADKRSFALLNAAGWNPGDFTAVPPASLKDVVAAHRIRCQAIDAPIGRFFYCLYAPPAAVIGIALNALSWLTAKLSALLVNPKNTTAPATLRETIDTHVRRAQNISFVVGKVGYTGYAAVTTPVTVVLNGTSWFTAQTAVAINDPNRFGRVLLGLMFLAVMVVGIVMVAGPGEAEQPAPTVSVEQSKPVN